MGGSAFPHLNVSRIYGNHVFARLHAHVADLLRPHYAAVARAPPLPGKTVHGDIDVIVLRDGLPDLTATAGSATTTATTTTTTTTTTTAISPRHELIVQALSAVAYERLPHSPVANYALRSPLPLGGDAAAAAADKEGEGDIFQLDIHECTSQKELEWMVFQHSYGDFWPLMRLLVRWGGLRLGQIGGLRIDLGGGRRVPLTRDPHTLLDFLGLDRDRYYGGVDGWQEPADMYRFIASGRFFSPHAFVVLNTRDQKLVRERPGMRAFVLDFLPSHGRASGGCDGAKQGFMLEEALLWFGKKAEHDALVLAAARAAAETNTEWARLRESLPIPSEPDRGTTAKRLRARWLATPAEQRWAGEGACPQQFFDQHWREEFDTMMSDRCAARAAKAAAKVAAETAKAAATTEELEGGGGGGGGGAKRVDRVDGSQLVEGESAAKWCKQDREGGG